MSTWSGVLNVRKYAKIIIFILFLYRRSTLQCDWLFHANVNVCNQNYPNILNIQKASWTSSVLTNKKPVLLRMLWVDSKVKNNLLNICFKRPFYSWWLSVIILQISQQFGTTLHHSSLKGVINSVLSVRL